MPNQFWIFNWVYKLCVIVRLNFILLLSLDTQLNNQNWMRIVLLEKKKYDAFWVHFIYPRATKLLSWMWMRKKKTPNRTPYTCTGHCWVTIPKGLLFYSFTKWKHVLKKMLSQPIHLGRRAHILNWVDNNLIVEHLSNFMIVAYLLWQVLESCSPLLPLVLFRFFSTSSLNAEDLRSRLRAVDEEKDDDLEQGV